MTIYLHTLVSIIILVIIILFVVYLRHKNFIKQENSLLFSWLIMQITLPALIFKALAHSTMQWHNILLFLSMFGIEMTVLLIAFGMAKVLKLEQKQMGSFLLVSVFGSSALLGYPLIAELFPHNSAVLTEAAFVSELGVGLPLFTIGVMIAIYFRDSKQNEKNLLSNAMEFFRSSLFLSIVAGVLWSLFSLPTKGVFVEPFFNMIHIFANANTFLVTLLVGVLLQFGSLSNMIKIMVAVIMLKLILTPLLVTIPASFMTLDTWQLQVLLLDAAMPSAMLSVVLAKRYGCDAQLAAKLVFVTLFASILTVSMMLKVLS
jgi:predicted permease